jgi:hypothetical protein
MTSYLPKGAPLRTQIATLTALAALGITSSAQATSNGEPPVTVSPKCQDGKIFVQPTPPGLLQINVDDHPGNDNEDRLNENGDGPSGYGYSFTVEPGQHTVRVRLWNPGLGWYYDKSFPVDCGTPAPVVVERIVEVPVEKIVYTPGPERVVEKVITKRVRVRAYCLLKIKNGKKVFYNCKKAKPKKKATPRRKLPGKRHDGRQNRGLPGYTG